MDTLPGPSDSRRKILTDPSLWGVAAGNGFAVLMALIQGWDLGEIMWIYWAQSVIIGLVNFYRILTLTEFSTEGLTVNGRPVPETQKAKRGVAFFFLFHYGFFHFGYVFFLWFQTAINPAGPWSFLFIALCVTCFACAHIFSFIHNRNRDFRHKKPNLGTVMFYPYMRIVPMHLTIIFGYAAGGGALLMFMILKTFADMGMHAMEHHLFQKK